MSRATSLALALCLTGTLVLAVAPTADATAVSCQFADTTLGGLVGRTDEYATNVGEAVCYETLSYAFYVCVATLGPAAVCYLA